MKPLIRISRRLWVVLLISCTASPAHGAAGEADSRFTPLLPLPKPKIIGSAVAFPDGNFNVERIVDGIVDPNRSS